MPSDIALEALVDIRHNIDLALGGVRPLTLVDFEADLKTFYAATRALEIISEASRRLPDEFVTRHPDISCRSMRDAGNLYRHNDDRVLEEFVWTTVLKSLPPLLAIAESEVVRGDPNPESRP